MFSNSITEQLLKHFSIPMRYYHLEEHTKRIIGITRYKNANSLLHKLREAGLLKSLELESRNGKHITIYCSRSFEKLTPYEVATALFPEGYFCNFSSIYYHSLTNQIPTSVYICHETIPAQMKARAGNINNSAIRGAFIKPHRYTNYVFNFSQYEVIVVDRAINSGYGVDKLQSASAMLPEHSRITCVERALIDAVVSPQYNGGIVSVYTVFKNARHKINAPKFIEIYKQLNFVYPYSQSIGFLLDSIGMTKFASGFYRKFPPTHTFFIDHNAKSSWSFDKKWKLYYPTGLIDEN